MDLETKIGAEWVKDAIMGKTDSYAIKYPQINRPNVFSTSSLSYDPDEQIWWKFRQSKGKPNIAMFAGKAIHEYLQTRLPSDFACEVQIEEYIPFHWSDATLNGITVMGHIDAYSLARRQLLEFKSSYTRWPSSKIADYHIRQTGFYESALERQNGIPFEPRVIRMNGGVYERILEPQDIKLAHDEIVERALNVAEALDGVYGSNAIEYIKRIKSESITE